MLVTEGGAFSSEETRPDLCLTGHPARTLALARYAPWSRIQVFTGCVGTVTGQRVLHLLRAQELPTPRISYVAGGKRETLQDYVTASRLLCPLCQTAYGKGQKREELPLSRGRSLETGTFLLP